MKVLGISGSARRSEKSGSYKLVKTVLENTGIDYELISLKGKTIGGCIACLGCAEDNVCKVRDDMGALREKIADADAYVVGSPNYYTGLNALTHAFLERWFQYRHQAGNQLWGKLGVAVGVGGMDGHPPAREIEKFFMYSLIETVTTVTGQGAASCYSCGHGETCAVGVPRMLYGEQVQITPEMIPDVEKQPDVMAAAADAGKRLGQRLTSGHDRTRVADAMAKKMMATLAESA